nr:MAG TPA: hypothetical protein [Caudoviricetes sp.]
MFIRYRFRLTISAPVDYQISVAFLLYSKLSAAENIK